LSVILPMLFRCEAIQYTKVRLRFRGIPGGD
jgi:hypothetical protein